MNEFICLEFKASAHIHIWRQAGCESISLYVSICRRDLSLTQALSATDWSVQWPSSLKQKSSNCTLLLCWHSWTECKFVGHPTEARLREGWGFFKRTRLLWEETARCGRLNPNKDSHHFSISDFQYCLVLSLKFIPESLIPKGERMLQVKTERTISLNSSQHSTLGWVIIALGLL